MLPHEKGSLHSVETCERHNGSFTRVRKLLNDYKFEVDRRAPATMEDAQPESVATAVSFLRRLPAEALEREKSAFQQYLNSNSSMLGTRFFCNCTRCASRSSETLGWFQACRAITYRTLGRHEDKNGRGEPCTSFGVTEPLSLSHLQHAFSMVHQPGLERALTPHEEPSFGDRSEEMPATDLEGPSSRRRGVNLQERSQQAPPHPSPVDLEAHLPGRDGATCRGQRGGVIGMHEDDLEDANKAEVFRLIMDILERKVLHNRTVADVTGELRNWRQSPVVHEHVRGLLPEDESQMLSMVDSIIGINRFTYDVCATKKCHHVFRCETTDAHICPRCGEERSTSLKMYYFSLIDTLRALYKSPQLARYLQFNYKDHPERVMEEGGRWDVFDTPCWKRTMGTDPYLSRDPRNIGLHLCTDGFQITKRKDSPSIWPISINFLNLPPWLRYKAAMTFMVTLLPKEITSIDTCFQPLIDELRYLYYVGLELEDPTEHQCKAFNMRAGVVKVTADYRGLPKIYLLGQSPSVHGCFYCKNMGLKIKEFKKTIYPGAWKWLGNVDEDDFTLRSVCSSLNNKSSEEVDPCMLQPAIRHHQDIADSCRNVEETRMALDPIVDKRELARVRGPTGEIGLSPLFRLPYFRLHEQNYDGMHTVANCIRDMFALLLGSHPSIHNNSRSYEATVNNRYKNKWMSTGEAPFVMKSDNQVCFKERLHIFRRKGCCRSELREGCSWHKVTTIPASLKAHDYHILCGTIGRWAIDGLYKKPYEQVVQIIFEAVTNMLVKSFPSSADCSFVEKSLVHAVALLEAIFPAFLLDHKWHQMLHLVSDLPTWVNSMWGFERFNRFLLCRIVNKSHPEGSLAEHYQCLQAVMLKKLQDSQNLDSTSRMWDRLGLERGFDAIVFPSQWRPGTMWLHGKSREVEINDEDVLTGLHLFYLEALVTTPDGQFLEIGGEGRNR